MIQFRGTGKARGDGDTLVPAAATLGTAEGRGRAGVKNRRWDGKLLGQPDEKEGRKEGRSSAMEPFISQSIWSSAGRGPAGIYISESACEAVANHRDGPFHFCKRCKLRTGGIFFLMLKF